MRRQSCRSLNALILWASLLSLAVLASMGEGKEYKIQKFLKDRDAWLDQKYVLPTDIPTADAEIAKWALSESVSTVRNAQTLECKRQFIAAHSRSISGDMPSQFPASCPKDGGGRKRGEGAAHLVFVSSAKDVKRAERIVEAVGKNKLKPWKPAESFVLVVDVSSGDAAKDEKLMERTKKVAAKLTNTRVATMEEVEDQGASSFAAYDKVKLPPRPSGRGVKLAYTLFVSPNDPLWRLYRVIHSIYSEQDFFFVHVDAQQSYASEEERLENESKAKQAMQGVLDIMAPMVAQGNMRVEPIYDVSWGGTSMLNAELAMGEALLEMGDWDYWINLSSTDYPLKPINKLREYLLDAKNWGYNYGWGAYQDPDDDEKNQGLKSTFVECEGHSFRVDDKFPIPRGVKLQGGSSWFVLSRQFVQWVDDCLAMGFDNRTKAGECSTPLMLLDYGQYKINFEEVFYQTVQANTGHCELVVNEDLRFINWSKDRDDVHVGCMHWEEVDWCGNSPQVMTEDKWDEGREKHDRFFSRKYESPVVFDHMDSVLGLNTTEGMPKELSDVMNKNNVLIENPRGQNIALHKVAFASSNQVNDDGKAFFSANVLDGNLNTRWSSDHVDHGQWITVKLSDNAEPLCNVTEVRVVWETAYAAVYDLQISEDMDKWEVVHSTTRDNRKRPKTKKELTHVIPINGGKGAMLAAFKLDLKHRATRWGFSIWEIEAYGKCHEHIPGAIFGDAPEY